VRTTLVLAVRAVVWLASGVVLAVIGVRLLERTGTAETILGALSIIVALGAAALGLVYMAALVKRSLRGHS
jgi:hypothetical protein